MSLTKRVTLDYDNVSEIEVLKSARGKGIHVILTLVKPIAIKKQLQLRRKLKDCKARLKYSKLDLRLGFSPDVLFTHKKVKGKWLKEKRLLKKKLV